MPIVWKIENIEKTDGSAYSTVAWRVFGAHVSTPDGDRRPTIYGTVSIENLTLDAGTTEDAVIEKVKHALNATAEQRDEKGNLIPPAPNAKSRTDEIEAMLVKQATELAHPKVHTVPLPWTQPAAAPAPGNKKSGAK